MMVGILEDLSPNHLTFRRFPAGGQWMINYASLQPRMLRSDLNSRTHRMSCFISRCIHEAAARSQYITKDESLGL
jgi:hypothetical protein